MNDDLSCVRAFCARYRRTVYAKTLLYRTASLAVAVLFALAAVQICFAMFPWIGFPLVWDCCIFLFVIGFGALCLDVLVLHRQTLRDVAVLVEKRMTFPHPWLSLSLELANQPSTGKTNLNSLLFETAKNSLAACPASPPWSVSWTKAAVSVTSLFAFLITLTTLSPACAGFWKLPASYFSPVRAVVSPGNILVPTGTTCTLKCVVRSSSFPSCRLSLTSADPSTSISTTRIIGADPSGAFSHTLNRIAATTVYQFSIGTTALPADTIRVAPRPYLAGLSVRLTPPAYTGLGPAALAEGQGNFAAYPGTKAFFHINAPYALKESRFVSSSGDTVPLSVSGREASCTVVVNRRTIYSFALTDTFGQTSDSVPLFSMEIIPDLPPSISFVKPGANMTCTPSMAETLAVEAIDDIGIRTVTVSMRKNRDSSFVYFARTVPGRDSMQKTLQVGLAIDLTAYSLYPGDTLFYWASACDNRTFGGAQCTATDTFFFRVPGFEEIHEQIAHEQDAAEAAVRTVRKKQDDMQKAASSLMQSSRNKQALSWEQQQIAKDLKEAVKAQGDSLQKAVESFKEAVDKLKQQQAVPPELLAKMDQVQKELEALRKQYGDSLLFKMPDQPGDLSLQDLRESLEKFKNMLPDLSKRLDNTLKFLAMLKRDQALAKLAADAQRLAQEQQNIAGSRENPGICQSKQETQCNGVDSLLSDIDKSAGPKSDSSLFSKNDLSALSQIRPLQNGMRSDLERKTMPSHSTMDRMSGSLMSLSGDLQNLQSCALAKKLDKERQALLSMAHDALSMSSWQRQLHDNAGRPSPDAGELAAHEQAIKQSLVQSSTKIDLLAMVSPQSIMSIKQGYDRAGLSIDRSLGFLAQRYGSLLSDDPQAALDILAKTIFDAISDMNNQPQSGSSGAGMMMQAMRRLSGKQAMLNAMTGELLKRMLGSGQPGSEQEGNGTKQGRGNGKGAGDDHARREAQAAQQAIADELKKLADKYGRDAGSSLDKKAKELEEEARRLARQFENLQPDLRDRQDRFLSRMLETTLSQHRQDEGKEDRVSQSAKNIFTPSPGAQNAGTAYDADSFYRLRQRAFSGNFPESYRFSVRNYFDSLGVLYLKGK